MPRFSTAFAPAAITNFFSLRETGPARGTRSLGAVGGGYILSGGVTSSAVARKTDGSSVSIRVDGDPNYKARTTSRALHLLLERSGSSGVSLEVEQTMEIPVGCGFGASSAAAISAAYAAGSALGLDWTPEKLALCAHDAEIIEQTGVGTVSVAYRNLGAGAITHAGPPGVAKFISVEVPPETRIVTASLSPYDKRDALSSTLLQGRINRLGESSLKRFTADPTLETLAREGESFSEGLGLETIEVLGLEGVAREAGAMASSQNMIGYAIHALTSVRNCPKVEAALRQHPSNPRVDVYRTGKKRAGVLRTSRR